MIEFQYAGWAVAGMYASLALAAISVMWVVTIIRDEWDKADWKDGSDD